MNMYFQVSLAPNTRVTYRSGLNAYRTFCKQLSTHIFPISEINLQLFVMSLASRVKFNTVKVYLCGIQYESIVRGYTNKISSMSKLHYVMRGIRRMHPNSSLQRLPITPTHLREMINFIQTSSFSNHDKAKWKCLILVAFFGLLRVSEYTCFSKSNYNNTIQLMPFDISFSNNIV